jgi:hypothetical protein
VIKAFLAIALVAAALASRAEASGGKYDNSKECQSYGLTPGSKDFQRCVASLSDVDMNDAGAPSDRQQTDPAMQPEDKPEGRGSANMNTKFGDNKHGVEAPLRSGKSNAGGWATFSDKSENAFHLQVPAGWRVQGGIERFSATNAQGWVTAVYPNGSTFLFLGDPSIPNFEEPNPAMLIQEGTWIVSSVGAAMPVAPYLPGTDFASLYAQHELSKTCSNFRPSSTSERPALVTRIEQKLAGSSFHPPGQRVDGGIALFSCDIKGKPHSAGVIAATVLLPLPNGGGIWYVAALYGFRTPKGLESAAERNVETMQSSFVTDPQWQASMQQAIQQRGAQGRAEAQHQADMFSVQLRREGQDLANTLQSRQSTYMNMMSQQAEDRNNAFDNHMRQKAWGQFNELMYINDEHCVWNNDHSVCIKVHN